MKIDTTAFKTEHGTGPGLQHPGGSTWSFCVAEKHTLNFPGDHYGRATASLRAWLRRNGMEKLQIRLLP